MVNGMRVELQDIDALRQAFLHAPDVVRAELGAAMVVADMLVLREVAERTPTAHGLLRQSLFQEERINDTSVIGVVASPLSYVAPVELGRKPGKMPPVDAIEDWVIQKLGVSVEEAPGIALAIARKIKYRGTQGAHMFQHGLEASAGQINGVFRKAAERVARAVGSAGQQS